MAKTDTQISCRVTHEFKARLEAQAASGRLALPQKLPGPKGPGSLQSPYSADRFFFRHASSTAQNTRER